MKSDPTYNGPRWQGFEPNVVQVVTPAPQPVTVIVVVDIKTGDPFGRPVGTDGGSDRTRPAAAEHPLELDDDHQASGDDDEHEADDHDPGPRWERRPRDQAHTRGAAALHRQGLLRAGWGAAPGAADTLGYSATARGGGVFDVLVTAANNGPERGTWRVDTRTGDFVPQDPTAAEVGAQCPELA